MSDTTDIQDIAHAPEASDAHHERRPMHSSRENQSARLMDPRLVMVYKPRSFEAEQFRLLRNNILNHQNGEGPPRCIMVTSAMPEEGKSFVACNLAACLAQNLKEDVILMDCDIRKPTQHHLLGLRPDAPGIIEYLTIPGLNLFSVLRRSRISGLHLLPAGVPAAETCELISHARIAEVLMRLKSRYADHYIIIDTPPPTFAAESNAIARVVDGIVLVVRSDRTPKEAVNGLIKLIGKEHIICTILNGYDLRRDSRYGYGLHHPRKYKGYFD